MRELHSLSPAQRMFVVHAAYGKAMLFAHVLELKLSMLLVCECDLSNRPKEQRQHEIECLKKLTLGSLIKEYLRQFSVSEEIREELDNMLFFRNELTHRISETMIFAVRKVEWEESLVLELNEIALMFRETELLLKPHAQEISRRLGRNEEIFEKFKSRFYPGLNSADSNNSVGNE